jgi:hypothetical protein
MESVEINFQQEYIQTDSRFAFGFMELRSSGAAVHYGTTLQEMEKIRSDDVRA